MGLVEPRQLLVLGEPTRVYEGGEGSTALLLLHGGWGGAATHWSRVWSRLAQRMRVVAPDLPGLGDLTQPGRACLADYVSWLNALLDALKIERVVCVGNSFGASLAWSFAGRSPQRCLGVVLVNGLPLPRTPAPLLWLGHRAPGRRLMRTMLRRVSFTPRALVRAFANPGNAPSELLACLPAPPPRRLETFLDCMISGDGAPAPTAPTMVVWGEADRLPGTSFELGRRLALTIPGARFVSLANAGHFPQLEHPTGFVGAVEAFVEHLHPPEPAYSFPAGLSLNPPSAWARPPER